VLVLELLCDGVPVGTRTSPTSRGLVQEHKVGPIPRGEVSGEVRKVQYLETSNFNQSLPSPWRIGEHQTDQQARRS
jgi:hypothetical protein